MRKYKGKGPATAAKSASPNLTNVLPFMLENINIANLERLRQVSPKYRNIINRSGILRRKIQEAQQTLRERVAARVQDPRFRYVNAPRWKEMMFPESRIGLYPTVGISPGGTGHRYARDMGSHIREYAGRTPRGTLPAEHKRTYNEWAREYSQAPYSPNNINKRHVARALLKAFRKRRSGGRPNRNNFPPGLMGEKPYRNAMNRWMRRGKPGGSAN
jgi:hypothetical protein